MGNWKQTLASALCMCMIANTVSPAYGQISDLPQIQQKTKTATASDAENLASDSDWNEDDEFLWEEELENDLGEELATDSDADLMNDLELKADQQLMTMEEVLIEKLEILNKPAFSGNYLGVGDTYQLEVEITPEDAAENYVWTSSNENVLTVSEDGLVTAVGEGYANIQVQSENSYDYTGFAVVPEAVSVTVHANGGTFQSNGLDELTLHVETGGYVNPETPVMEGKVFGGIWYLNQDCTEPVSQYAYFYPDADMDVYAGWSEFYTITYDYNGVTYNNETEKVYQISQGSTLSGKYPYFPSDPSQTEGKLWKGWQNQDGELITNLYSYIPSGDETLTALWSDDYYTVYLDYNGGTYPYDYMKMGEVKYVVDGNSLGSGVSDLNPPQANQTLKGWLTESGELISNQNLYQYIPKGNETLTATWSEFYTVTFDLDGGTVSGTGGNPQKIAVGNALTSYPRPTKAGFVLNGWKVLETGEFMDKDNRPYTPKSNVTLVAQWSGYWTITFDANGGTCTDDYYKTRTVAKGTPVYLSDYGFAREGFVLDGWCTDAACEGKVLTGNYVPTSDTTLYAKWTAGKRLTFDAGEGAFSGGAKTLELMHQENQSLGSVYVEKPVRNGYALEGWYLEPEYQTRVTQAYRVTNDVTFYARWVQDGYRVSLHAGGPYYYDRETGSYVSEYEYIISAGNKVGNITTPNRSGYAASWYLDSNFTKPLNDKYVPEGDIDLYAKYVRQLTIQWDGDGGRNNSGKSSGNYLIGEGERAPLDEMLYKDGAAFDGWYTLDGRKVDRTTVFYEDAFLKARWTEGCRITLDLDGGRMPSYSEEKYLPYYYAAANQPLEISDFGIEKEGYSLTGWKDSNTGTVYDNLYNVSVSVDTVFTVQWTSGHAVALHAQGGVIYDVVKKTYVADKVIYVVDDASKDYYELMGYVPEYDGGYLGSEQRKTFVGWSLTEGGEIIDPYTYNLTGVTDLYAVWGDTARVIYILNGGVVAGNTASTYCRDVAVGNELEYPADNEVLRNGYTFDGWYETPDFSGNPIYIPESHYQPTANIFLYAKWIEGNVATYTVTFDSTGGSAVGPSKVREGECAAVPENPVKDGEMFDAWYTDAACTQKYDFASPVYKDITLYAGWVETVDLHDARVEITENCFYTGEQIRPELEVYMGSRLLTAEKDYTVSYGENLNAGEGTVTVTATADGGCTGSKTVVFIIEKAEMNQPVPQGPFTASYGDQLSDVALGADGWIWKDPTQSTGEVGEQKHLAVFKASDDNHKDQEAEITVTVSARSLEDADVTLIGEAFAYTGEAICPEVTVTCSGIELTKDVDYTVTYGENVNAGSKGGCVIITGMGNYDGIRTEWFDIQKADPSLSIANQIYEMTYGDTLADISLPEGWIWQDPAQTSGDVTGTGNRNFLADFTTYDGCNYDTKTGVSIKVKVLPRDLTAPFVTIDKNSYIYDQIPVEPAVTVKDPVPGMTGILEAETDYEVAYSNNDGLGTGTVTISGKGNYSGVVTINFEIIADPYDIAGAQVTVNPEENDYTGEAITPDVTVALAGNVLQAETDYTVTYRDNIQPGFGMVIVTGTGSRGNDEYYGEKSVSFFIRPAVYELKAVYAEQLKEILLPDGWTWQNPDVYVGDVTAEGETRRFQADFTNGAEARTAEFGIAVVPKPIDDTTVKIAIDKDSIVYDPETPAVPKIAITDEKLDAVLIAGRDYEVSCTDNTSAGEASVTITGIGNYAGEYHDGYTIEKADSLPTVGNDKLVNGKLELSIKDEPFDLLVTYMGDGEVTFTSGDERIFTVEKTAAGNDGRLTVRGIGTATLTITVAETDNYKSAELIYDVNVALVEITKADVEMTGTSYVYTGDQIKPEVTVTVDGVILEPESPTYEGDYTVSYGENVNAGTGSVMVTGKGIYTGNVTVNFDIEKSELPPEVTLLDESIFTAEYGQKLKEIWLPKFEPYGQWIWENPESLVGNAGSQKHNAVMPESANYKQRIAAANVSVSPKRLEDDMVTLEYTETAYTGEALEPKVTVMHGETAVDLSEFDITYKDNVHPGTATVRVHGRTNYSYFADKTFKIKKAVPVITVEAGTTISRLLGDGIFALGASVSNDQELTYVSSDENIAAVDKDGQVTVLKAGNVDITVMCEGNADYEAASLTVKLVITEENDENTGDTGNNGGSGSSGSSGSTGGSGSSGGSAGSGSSVSSNRAATAAEIAAAAYQSVPAGYDGPVRVIHETVVPIYVQEGNWTQKTDGSWNFTVNGAVVKNAWAAAYNPYADQNNHQQGFDWFLFDKDGNMVTGWYTDEAGDTYYMNPLSDNTRGRMVTGWNLIDGAYYYFNENPDGKRGRLLKNTVSPDGYRIDGNGMRREKTQ